MDDSSEAADRLLTAMSASKSVTCHRHRSRFVPISGPAMETITPEDEARMAALRSEKSSAATMTKPTKIDPYAQREVGGGCLAGPHPGDDS